MKDRSATATIKGYYYQFDTSILKVLELSDSGKVTIEGIEDIDIETATEKTAVQCKYLSEPKFINSAVRKPITLMLDHFVANSATPINYTLYAHFENETGNSERIITLQDLKSILTYKEKKVEHKHHVENGISDTQLEAFLKKFKLVFGQEFEQQQKEVVAKLKKVFGCSDFAADVLYYNNALRIIIDKAKSSAPKDKLVKKSDFISLVKAEKILFNEWYIKLRSKNEYIQSVVKNVKSSKQTTTTPKYIFIGEEILKAANHELPVANLIESIVNKYFKMSHAPRNAKPMTFILECNKVEMQEVKKSLILSNIRYNDGFEDISFSQECFNEHPIVNVNNNNTKITKSSFQLKLITQDTFIQYSAKISIPKVVYHFSNKQCHYSPPNCQIFDIKYCETLKDLLTILS